MWDLPSQIRFALLEQKLLQFLRERGEYIRNQLGFSVVWNPVQNMVWSSAHHLPSSRYNS
jgi:hypothetical protein